MVRHFKAAEPEGQAELLAKALSGCSRDEMEKTRRKARNENGQTVKVPSIKIALPGGISVAVKGMDRPRNCAESCAAAGKAIKKAISENLDAKTAQAAWRCKQGR